MKINKYLVFAFIYFFLNSVGLPFGLTYTALLSPFLYWWVISTRKKEVLVPFIIISIPFVVIHLSIVGVNSSSYLLSFLNFFAIYIFCQAFYTFLKICKNPEEIFSKLLMFNFILCLVAIVFYFTPFYYIFWIQQPLTEGIENFRRLRMFTYEASHYSTLFTPLFVFFFLQICLNQNRINAWILFPMLLLPYILSFSLGVISLVMVSILLTWIFYFNTLMRQKRGINLFILFTLVIFIASFLLLAFPANTFIARVGNFFLGNDPSGKGRTVDAFILANKILAQKSSVWGVGAGQIKIIGADIVRQYYVYDPDYNVITIPNAMAETLTLFGWVGFGVRLLIELFLFYYTKVWSNLFRLALFIFIFIYQFTGSFITNLAEYVIWIIAFTNAFPQFNMRKHSERSP